MYRDEFYAEMLSFLTYLHGGKLDTLDFGSTLKYDEEIAAEILNNYLPKAIRTSLPYKRYCLEIMIESCNKNSNHGLLKRWKKTLESILVLFILPFDSYHDLEKNQPQPCDLTEKAISAIIRLFPWGHSFGGYYAGFGSYAIRIEQCLLGDGGLDGFGELYRKNRRKKPRKCHATTAKESLWEEYKRERTAFEETLIKAGATPEWIEAVMEGAIEGINQGIEYGKVSVAKAALAEGLSVNTIRKITRLDKESIRRIAGSG